MSESRIDALADRILYLECQNRQLKWLGSTSLLAIIAVVAVGAARAGFQRDQVEKVIRAENFVAVDEAGRGVIGIGTNIREKGRGAIEFLDKTGKRRMALGLEDDDSPFIVLMGEDERYRIDLETKTGMGLGISIRDTKRNSGLILGTSANGDSGLGIMGDGGKLIVEFGVNSDDSTQLIFRDKNDKELQRLPKP